MIISKGKAGDKTGKETGYWYKPNKKVWLGPAGKGGEKCLVSKWFVSIEFIRLVNHWYKV